jgi:nitrite reductase/ring-hydroxylating ferredoxin subunit
VGLVHAVGNGVGLACFIRSWLRRKDGGGGRTWALLGVAAASGAGWLGGHLAFSMGVGVDTNAFQTGPAEWTATTRSGEPGRISAHQVDGVRVAVFEMGEGEHALADRCSHRGGPLSEGTLEQSCVVCPWHGSRFDVRTGRVRGGPATADQPGYEVRTVGEVTEVRRSESRALRRNPV